MVDSGRYDGLWWWWCTTTLRWDYNDAQCAVSRVCSVGDVDRVCNVDDDDMPREASTTMNKLMLYSTMERWTAPNGNQWQAWTALIYKTERHWYMNGRRWSGVARREDTIGLTLRNGPPEGPTSLAFLVCVCASFWSMFTNNNSTLKVSNTLTIQGCRSPPPDVDP